MACQRVKLKSALVDYMNIEHCTRKVPSAAIIFGRSSAVLLDVLPSFHFSDSS